MTVWERANTKFPNWTELQRHLANGCGLCYSDLLDASWHSVYTFQPAIRPVVWTVGCTTGWVNYANEPNLAALERSSQDAYDVVRLIWRVWSKLRKNSYLFIYLFVTIGTVAYDPEGWQKLHRLQHSVDLLYKITNIQNVTSSRLYNYNRLYNWL